MAVLSEGLIDPEDIPKGFDQDHFFLIHLLIFNMIMVHLKREDLRVRVDEKKILYKLYTFY
jgi:hypothetical protein